MDAHKDSKPTTDEASTNFYWTCGETQVFNLQTTVRGAMTPDQFKQHVSSVINALAYVVDKGGKAKPVGQQSPQASTVIQPTNGAAVLPTDGEQSFPAELLVGSILEGKPSWKVKGGRWTQFGVTIWPEAMPATIDGKKVENGGSYPLVGFTAYYVNKPDGKPQKVVRLVKA